ncbi:MAG: SusD/RagB family nutrient-binding outer membrane lipoprotein [Massilibacteroides sp.]|nr:SusD/RagB family nutrient-binding outer membrane lipoprotein [Massilibacteroides sp.]MDD3062919.1 SusD/RagB family nutrient-binding outer membrane lipoprotein [Massilibacteroides sp.]MDD4114991.1 SusD/RagB family nutrient-binding outer membrane lipoprotein [Massilibacteroides sp.]MDD4660444.1 SusD/RagB family nutrient-binding outer membrane lipoprotein [Massilibacteroides sp.]
MKKIYIILAVSSFLFASTVGCTSSFDEINTDPDAYTSVPYTNVLANVLRRTADQFGGDLDIGQWAGYVSAIQYLNDYNNYIPTNNTYGNRWYQSYWGYVQLQDILDRTEESVDANKNIRNVCILMQNYLMFMAVDCFGDIPYSEAFKGSPEAGSVLQTPYDKQSEIYPKILENLKTVADSWSTGLGSDELGKGDFLFNGDAAKWQKFCNSIRLRIAMRISGVYPESKSIIEEIFNNSDKYPYITETKDNAYFWWQGSGEYYERYYQNFRSRDDDGMADIFIDHLKMMEDPRIAIYAKPAKSDGEYRGFENGSKTAPLSLSAISRIGVKFREDPAGFSPFYRACESYFMMSEAALNGWNVPMSAQEAYENGVRLSMADNDIDDADTEAYLSGKGKWDDTYARLYFEEWVALFKQNIEAWSLYRRTGYPTYIHTSKAADGTSPKYPGARSVYNGIHNDVPFRFPYPNNQYLYNEDNVKAAAANVKDHVWGEQVWWDTRTDVH